MVDTPAEKPKRRTTKAKSGDTPSPAPAKRAASTRAKTPVQAKAADKPVKTATAAPKAAAAPKPRAPRKAAAPRKTVPAAPVKAAPAPAPAPAATAAATPVSRGGWLAAIGAAAAVGGAWLVWRASRADEPDYQVVEQDGAVEVRKYPSLVTASTHNAGERDAALGEGFQTLADYIFAKSRPGPKLAMTAPVLSDHQSDGRWRTRFIMPTGKARAELPAPPAGVELASEPGARVAAIGFSGRPTNDMLEDKEQQLRSWLQLKGYPHEARAVHAFYNAPFLPGPLRRNEVLIRLSSEGGTGL
jgi:hypothetical protein